MTAKGEGTEVTQCAVEMAVVNVYPSHLEYPADLFMIEFLSRTLAAYASQVSYFGLDSESLESLLSFLGSNRLLQAAALLLAFLILAKFVDFLFTRLLRQFTSSTRFEIDDQIAELLHQPVFWTMVLIGVGLAVQVAQAPPGFQVVVGNLVRTLVVLFWLLFGVQASVLLLGWMTRHPDRFQLVQPATLPLFEIATKVVLLGAAFYFVFISWGVDVTGWVASAGIIGIVVGFAARDTLANLFAGVFILADAPYRIGDFIVLDGGERGQVTKIGLRSTRILTRDDIEITIPNATIANSKIVNESGGPSVKERVRVKVGVAYGSDIDRVQEVLLASAHESRVVAADPAPRVRFRQFGESSLDFELLCWIDEPVLRGRATHDLHQLIYKGLAQAGIHIPFPQRDVYIKELPETLRERTGKHSEPV